MSPGLSVGAGPGSAWSGADHGNFELVVLEEGGPLGRGLVHYWRDNSGPPYSWIGPDMIDRNATSQPCLFQTYGGPGPHGDFHLVVQEAGQLAHWYRDNSGPPYAWHYVGSILGPGEKATGPGCACQGTRGPDSSHWNFELVVCVGGKLEYRYRDSASPSMPWPGKWV